MVKAGEQDPRRLAAAAERREQALALWLDRHTFQEIADLLGYSDRSSARKAIMTALEETAARTAELAEKARPMLVARYERLYQRWADKADDDLKAAGFTLQVLDRLVRINGFDKLRVEATVTNRSELDAEIEDLIRRVASHAPTTPTTERTP